MEWKVRKVGDRVQVKPVLKKGQKVWIKKVRDINWEKDNGFSFVGEFVQWWLYTDVSDGDVFLMVDKSVSPEEEAIVFRFENGKVIEKARFGYRSAFSELRRFVAELLGSEILEVEEEIQDSGSSEKLIVEFDVERTVKRRYGYEEKFLKYRGNVTPYKAILKDGKLVAIVKRRYVLVENEFLIDVVEKVADKNGWSIEVIDEFPRVHIVVDRGDDVKVVVNNSVDGTLSLRADLMVKVDDESDVWSVFRLRDIGQVYRRHVGEVSEFVSKFDKVLEEVFDSARKYVQFLKRLNEVEIAEIDDMLKALIVDVVGKKYEGRVLFAIKGGRIRNYGDLYKELSKIIWLKNNIQFKTKIEKFDKLNKMISLASEVELYE